MAERGNRRRFPEPRLGGVGVEIVVAVVLVSVLSTAIPAGVLQEDVVAAGVLPDDVITTGSCIRGAGRRDGDTIGVDGGDVCGDETGREGRGLPRSISIGRAGVSRPWGVAGASTTTLSASAGASVTTLSASTGVSAATDGGTAGAESASGYVAVGS